MSELNLSTETMKAMLNAESQVLSMQEVEQGIYQGKMFHPMVRSEGTLEYIRQKYQEKMTNGNIIFYCPEGLNVTHMVVAGSVSTNNEIPVVSCVSSNLETKKATEEGGLVFSTITFGLILTFMLIIGLGAFLRLKKNKTVDNNNH